MKFPSEINNMSLQLKDIFESRMTPVSLSTCSSSQSAEEHEVQECQEEEGNERHHKEVVFLVLY